MINMQQQLAALFSGDQDAMGKVLMGLGIGAGDVHIDRALSNLAVSYANEEYIADKVLPVLPVKNRSDKYFKFDTDMNFNVANAAMASQRGRPGEINYGLTTDNYSVSDYGLMDSIPFDVEANADAPLDIQSVAVETLTNFLMLAREIRVANLFVAGNFTGSTAALSGTNRWDDYTNSDPVKAIETVIDAPLVRPNTMICGIKTWKMLRQHPKVLQYIISRAATVNGAVPMRPTKQLFADAFELDAVYVPKPRYNNSNAVGTLSCRRSSSRSACAFSTIAASFVISGSTAAVTGARRGWSRSTVRCRSATTSSWYASQRNASIARLTPAAGSMTAGTKRSPVPASTHSSVVPEASEWAVRSNVPRFATPSSSDQPIGYRYSTSLVALE